ncbi:Coq4 family protein [Dinghuibacter silviterrae]|uniref:Ubiquinone biosynthesis protein COQ4 n=1 Tax=Dinghuibacter silviterrae TaxID=1539049 RepID=A0A4V3GLG5_9BACT|nr:Coq4 family protein [Dinghuibacter silviterrae]TDW99442.1 ubiquinone biosynthesis protein COQ4 [Dinghuibacter silviterrae]
MKKFIRWARTRFSRARTWLLVFLTHECALPVLKVFRRPAPFPYTLEALEALPKDTLGHALVQFIREKDLSLLVHYARHDLKHILLDYDTTDKGEVCLQSFMLGNGRVSFPVVATVVYGVCTMPEYWKAMRDAWRRGRRCRPIHGWDWFSLLEERVEVLQKKIYYTL